MVVWGFVRQLGPTYQVHFSYLVSLGEREAAGEFRFDGYYALSATDLFAATLAEWVKTPEVIAAAYERSGVDLESRDSRSLARTVLADKLAPQLVVVTVQHRDRGKAERLAEGLREVMSSNVDSYHDQGIPALRFRVVATKPWLGVSRLSQSVITGAVFVFVLLAGLNLVILLESVRRMP